MAARIDPQRTINEQYFGDSLLKNESSEKVIKAFREHTLPSLKTDAVFLKEVESIDPAQLSQILKLIAQELSDSDQSLDQLSLLAQILPLEKLQGFSLDEGVDPIDALQTAKDLFTEAKLFLDQTEDRNSASVYQGFKRVLEVMLNFIETLLSLFGMSDFFKPADNDLQTQFKVQKVSMLVGFFSVLSTTLFPTLGAATGGIVVGAVVLTMILLSLIYPFIRPAPSQLPQAENWTSQLEHSKPVVGINKGTLDKIALSLAEAKKTKIQPLLVGPSSGGKKKMVSALLQEILKGGYPEFKGKKGFYINAAALINCTDLFGGDAILKKISYAMGNSRDQMILIIDKIDLLYRPKQSHQGQLLKELIDSGQFPYVIGMTTEESYNQILTSSSVKGAFNLIKLENPNSADINQSLSSHLLHEAPNLMLEKNILEYLVSKSIELFPKDAPQPSTALSLLDKCIQTANLELETLEKSVKEEDAQLKKFIQSQEKLQRIKSKMFKNIVKINDLQKAQDDEKNKVRLNKFLICNHFLAPTIESQLKSELNRKGVKAVIDQELVNKVIMEELLTRRSNA